MADGESIGANEDLVDKQTYDLLALFNVQGLGTGAQLDAKSVECLGQLEIASVVHGRHFQ
jgi:hypothetical protein